MSILSSASSARSILSPRSNGYIENEQSQPTPGITPSLYTGIYPKSAKFPKDGLNINPDELFTKYTVSEVKAVQQRLRTDAEAKQEELRLMVGERYRDLLQASSSIISIAKSSRRVSEALEECTNAIHSQQDLPPPPKTAALGDVDDRHLYTLQVLSAHMKLLLDAPEHLWRLIERKKYLPAAWLFLLARVVHRALVHNDDDDEQQWISEGVDVLIEFPLVQRQWEVVSQFRSQIIHKSTLSLRETSSSTEDTCATLVTLHLLDSRPLNETLAALLFQRSKTLQSVLSWNPESGTTDKNKSYSNSNGHAVRQEAPKSTAHMVPVREVTQVVKKALNTLSQTVCAARGIFQSDNSEPSLIGRVLESIQADPSEPNGYLKRLPDELYLSTQSLLFSLTSSANFQLLPSDLRSYKPYVDLNSASTALPQKNFTHKLQEWFKQSSKLWHDAAGVWFSKLQNVKEVWTLRTSIRRWLVPSGLNENEKAHLSSIIDSLCHERIIGIWKLILSDAETRFKSRLQASVSLPEQDSNPVEFLFQSPPIPILSQSIKSFVDIPFQKYQLALKRQLVSRSAQLDDILSTLEQCARTIQHDFSHLRAGRDDKTALLIDQLVQTYQPAADSLICNVKSIVDEAVMNATEDPDSSVDGLVFLIRVTGGLASASLFGGNIGCSPEVAEGFMSNLLSSNDKTVRKWREKIVARISKENYLGLRKQSSSIPVPNGPSPQLLKSLLSVCDSIQRLGVLHPSVKQNAIVQDTLRSLFTCWSKEGWEKDNEQDLHDIAFLRKLADLYGPAWSDISALLADQLKANSSGVADLEQLQNIASEYLARVQTLFSVLLPNSSSRSLEPQLLQFGLPSMGQSYHSAIDLAKPSPRFGMLLIGNVEH
ncbi:hypothetical protein B0H34DRAFT_24536 [Crassisporium funariophilum]|nr:hypothetical protein B0H34DRAFT_24536 [Crassisporium funariophilum]